eukprot:561148-Lingulodinium_polyedra.AAC.1
MPAPGRLRRPGPAAARRGVRCCLRQRQPGTWASGDQEDLWTAALCTRTGFRQGARGVPAQLRI